MYSCYILFVFSVVLALQCICVDRDEMVKVIHSNDAFAPVAYLNLCRMHLEEKSAKEHVCNKVIVYLL